MLLFSNVRTLVSSTLVERFDVVIIGGSCVGSSAAFHLAEKMGTGKSICVIERDPTVCPLLFSFLPSLLRPTYTAICFLKVLQSFCSTVGRRNKATGSSPFFIVTLNIGDVFLLPLVVLSPA